METLDRRNKIFELEMDIIRLKKELQVKRTLLKSLIDQEIVQETEVPENPYCKSMSSDEIIRYSRQMLIPSIEVEGQLILKNSRALLVGAGGLGCPAALYLAAAGIGHISIIDGDCVESTNLHRQILHDEFDIGVPKVLSAKESLKRLNKFVNVQAIQMHLNGENIGDLIENFDVVIDGTDNVATRYMLNDACVFKNKPLVSGSALQLEGQLSVFNYNNGPCYRCLYPIPPPAHTVTSCGDGGVLGVVPGCIGTLQALEAIKILLKMPGVLTGRLLVFDGADTKFINAKLRNRDPKCAVCGDNPTITKPVDYEQFCQANAHDKIMNIDILPSESRITNHEFNTLRKSTDKYLLIDVRSMSEFKMCSIPESVNIPYDDIKRDIRSDRLKKVFESENVQSNDAVYVVCRRGNDSQRAIKLLQEEYPYKFKDVVGGLYAFHKIDKNFPVY